MLPWDPWLPRCSKNLARSCQDSQDASKRVNPGNHPINFLAQIKQNWLQKASCSSETQFPFTERQKSEASIELKIIQEAM